MNYYIIATILISILLIYVLFIKQSDPIKLPDSPTAPATSNSSDTTSYKKYLSSTGDWEKFPINSISMGHFDSSTDTWVDDIGVEGCTKRCDNTPDCKAFSYDVSENVDTLGRTRTGLCRIYNDDSRQGASDLITFYARNT